MKQRLGYRSLLLALCALVCLLLPSAVAAAEDAAPPTHAKVRVGYSVSGSMLYRDEDGHYLGYDALYLYEIARYTGWDYEFIPYTNWSQAVADVAAGRIDLLPTALKTPEREKEMLFSLYPMASTHIGIIARPGDARYVYGDFASTDGARVGVREQTADTKAFYKWAAKNGLSFRIARYDDRGDLLAALRAGDIDLAATSYAGEAQKFPASPRRRCISPSRRKGPGSPRSSTKRWATSCSTTALSSARSSASPSRTGTATACS